MSLSFRGNVPFNPFSANDEYTRPALHALNDGRRVYSFSKSGGLNASVDCLGAVSADLRLDLDRGHVYQAVHNIKIADPESLGHLFATCVNQNEMDRMHVRKKMVPAGNECYNVFLFSGFYI